jgi:hypothetical protein
MRYYMRGYYSRNKPIFCARTRKNKYTLKMEVLTHYSKTSDVLGVRPSCARCGFSDDRALSIDHINGGGLKHLREIHAIGSGFYRWLKKNNFPEGFQVLCMNCQWIKRAEKGETRH